MRSCPQFFPADGSAPLDYQSARTEEAFIEYINNHAGTHRTAGGLLNQFAWPISLEQIGWRTYIVFTVWDAIQFVVFYFLLPETKKRTLEELDVVFAAKNPVKESLAVKRLEFSEEGAVVGAEKL